MAQAVGAGGGAKGLRNMFSSRKLTQEWRRRGQVDGERRCPLLECRLGLQEARVPGMLSSQVLPGVDPMGEGMGQGKKSEPV